MNTPMIFLTIALVVLGILVVWLTVQLVRTSAERARLGRALKHVQNEADLWRNACQRTIEKLEAVVRKQRTLEAQISELQSRIEALKEERVN